MRSEPLKNPTLSAHHLEQAFDELVSTSGSIKLGHDFLELGFSRQSFLKRRRHRMVAETVASQCDRFRTFEGLKYVTSQCYDNFERVIPWVW